MFFSLPTPVLGRTSRDSEANEPVRFLDALSSRQVFWCLVAIVLLGTALRIARFSGFLDAVDDAYYLPDAASLAHGHFIHTDHWSLRVGLVAPVALCIRLFGLHDWSIALYPLTTSLCALVLIFFLGTELYSRGVGLVAALLLACFPLAISEATVVLPDMPGAFLAGLSVLLAVLSARRRAPVARAGLTVAAGLALVAAYFTWEVNLIVAPAVLLALWLGDRRDAIARTGICILTILIGLGLEALLYWSLTGHPLLRFTVAHNRQQDVETAISMSEYLLRWPVVLVNPAYPQFFAFTVASVAGIIWSLRRSVGLREVMLFVWLMTVFVTVGYGLVSLRPITPLVPVQIRYLDDLIYPALLLASRLIYSTCPTVAATHEGTRA